MSLPLAHAGVAHRQSLSPATLSNARSARLANASTTSFRRARQTRPRRYSSRAYSAVTGGQSDRK